MENSSEIRSTNAFPLVLEQVVKWWLMIQGPHASGERAMLRRLKSPDEVALQSVYYKLLDSVLEIEGMKQFSGPLASRLPFIAGILAHVEQDNPGCPIAKSMGMKQQGSDRPTISDLRFRKILRTDESAELYIIMIRIVKMLGKKADVRNLIQSLYFWNEQTKKSWASQYYLQKDIY
ncbi:MAG: type I-E CRISPR-associated protein Cse2/CasB [Bacteroidia bacterium]|nr:type I-E CRISPR-associated protein Cse2/CasB [uncultured Sphaerochaeta sp.]NCB97011.1 type I-E CRISPR-associated protein Cse2/CasB [Bacteroidia bacterium]NCC88759.1 type I-E CRISPR-associated protein Cse2/CasB [Spirochaetia bacterium]